MEDCVGAGAGRDHARRDRARTADELGLADRPPGEAVPALGRELGGDVERGAGPGPETLPSIPRARDFTGLHPARPRGYRPACLAGAVPARSLPDRLTEPLLVVSVHVPVSRGCVRSLGPWVREIRLWLGAQALR